MNSIFSFWRNKRQDSQTLFNNWLTKIIQNETPDSSIIAVNIGIFETKKGFQLYFAGFKDYDKDNDDWATGFGDFSPKDKYLLLDSFDFKGQDWEIILNKVVDLTKNFLKTDLYKNSFLEKTIAITTGFDDGELLKIK